MSPPRHKEGLGGKSFSGENRRRRSREPHLQERRSPPLAAPERRTRHRERGLRSPGPISGKDGSQPRAARGSWRGGQSPSAPRRWRSLRCGSPPRTSPRDRTRRCGHQRAGCRSRRERCVGPHLLSVPSGPSDRPGRDLAATSTGARTRQVRREVTAHRAALVFTWRHLVGTRRGNEFWS